MEQSLYNSIVTELSNLKGLFEEKINYIEESLKKYDEKINSLENKINNICLNNKFIIKEEIKEDLVNLKKENIDIDKEIVLRALTYKDYRTVLMIFKHYYKKKTNINHKYPIRCIGKRSFEYFNGEKWINDTYGHYIRKTLLMNIQTLLFKHNTNEHVSEISSILLYQDFIYKLSEEKHMKSFFRHIVDEIKNP